MGGSFGAEREPPEFNMRCDPEAAQVVFHAGWQLSLIGIDITRQVKYTRAEFAALKGGHPATRLLKEMAPGWIDRVESMGWEQDGCSLHDAVAAAYLLNNSLLQFEKIGVEVELHDIPRRGVVYMRKNDSGIPQARVATGIDVKACHDLVWSHIQLCE